MRSRSRPGILALCLVTLSLLGGACNWLDQVEEEPAPLLVPEQHALFFPVVQENLPPDATTSYYLKTIDGGELSVMGCATGVRHAELSGPQDGVVILDFGTPTFHNGKYGATLFGFGPVSVDEIAIAVQYYAWGYYVCLQEDFNSHLTIAVGTNNYFGGTVTYAHGQAWAEMVNNINTWSIENGYSGQVLVVGASDIEVGWNTPEISHDWVNGYDSANEWPLYSFGDAAGCPPSGQCGTSSFPSWTQEDIWYHAWGSPPSFPLPLIYANTGVNANQWFELSVYSYDVHGEAMQFLGAVTQYQACQQRPSPICDLLDNTPREGWAQLRGFLNSDPRTAQSLPWVTDFKWDGE